MHGIENFQQKGEAALLINRGDRSASFDFA